MDDAQLVERIRNGDQSAWEDLVDRHSALLWRVARSVVNVDAAAGDAMQTAWMRLLQNVDRLAEPAAVKGWLCTTTRREAIALSKSRRRQAPTDPHDWSFETASAPADDPGERAAGSDQNATVLEELAKLSERCRELLTLHAHKVAYEDIASTMDMAIGSIGPTKARCLEQLRRAPAIAQLEASR